MKNRHLPEHLQNIFCPQRDSAAGRLLEWFAGQPEDRTLSTEDILAQPRFFRHGRRPDYHALKTQLRGALGAGYLARDELGVYSRGPRWVVWAALRTARAQALCGAGVVPHPTYSPPHNSWGRVVCEFFRANPEEELTLDDITEKFRNPHVRPPMSPEREDWFLGRVRREGYLRRTADTYSAGPNIDKLPTLFRSVGATKDQK